MVSIRQRDNHHRNIGGRKQKGWAVFCVGLTSE